MEGVLERVSIEDPEASTGSASEATLVLVKAYVEYLLL